MAKKQFKTESKKLLDMMINSVYTHKEIFLREIISNASDAIGKRRFRALTDTSLASADGLYEIRVVPDKGARTFTVSDNGCGMTKEELENNLGTIAKSGSLDFKKDGKEGTKDIIGQFGVGFYSAFMVADKITVTSKAVGSEEAWQWESSGADGYTVVPAEKLETGTDIVLHIKDDTEDERYSVYLEDYQIRTLVRKYSDYIPYPIKMEAIEQKPKEGSEGEYETVKTDKTLNSMTPLWKRTPSSVTAEEYASFYREKYYDFEEPVKTIHFSVEGLTSFTALLYIPGKAPNDYYSKAYEKGLQLYCNGVLIMEKCPEMLPDCFSFVRGIIDSPDFTLNLSRETLQHDSQVRRIAKTIERKIKTALEDMLKTEREKYVQFWKAFGLQIKYGVYIDYGSRMDLLKDLLVFESSSEKKLMSLKEYTERAKPDQKSIYYACAPTVDQALMLPQSEAVIAKGFDVLCLTQDVDEFAFKMLNTYEDFKFVNVTDRALDVLDEDEKKKLEEENTSADDMFKFMKDVLGDKIAAVRFSSVLKDHPVCLASEGAVSLEMANILNSMPGAGEEVKATTVLEINMNHAIAGKLKALYESDKDTLSDYTKILFAQACLIGGVKIEDPSALSDLVCGLMVK